MFTRLKAMVATRRFAYLISTLIIVFVLARIFLGRSNNGPVYRLAEVRRGDLLVNVSATGTVEPEEVIDVGAQVAGMIDAFGKDRDGKTIDYGSVVEEGTVLAHIDESLYASDVAVAEASLKRAEADLAQLKARLVQADADWKRASKLGPSEALSQSNYDAYKAAFEVAKANVLVGEAALLQAQAAAEKARRNLGYCTIKSPIKGVIIDRRVNIGQTVVSSLNAPSLFLLAKDLKRMQVWVAVNEADIGSIHPGQNVRFTVDAFPGENFQGQVGKIRLNASVTSNVVTYTVEVLTDNSSGKLLPYLTANAQFEVADLKNVLLVPNSALRWVPGDDAIAPDARTKNGAGETHKKAGQGESHIGQATLWVPAGRYVRPVKVETGGSDGTSTHIKKGEFQEGSSVVVGVEEAQAREKEVANPFTPQIRRR